MCANCGFPAAAGHWTEAGADTAQDRMRARFRRVQILRNVLPAYGLTAYDDGQTPGIQLATMTGNQVTAENLEQLWLLAEQLTGRPVDPLSPEVLGTGKAG
jgi:hypothetical protein